MILQLPSLSQMENHLLRSLVLKIRQKRRKSPRRFPFSYSHNKNTYL